MLKGSKASYQPATSANTFLLFAFSWSLAFWTLTVMSGGIEEYPGSILQYAGGAGPIVAALVLIHFYEQPDVQKDFWARTFDIRRMTPVWFLTALFIHPLIVFVAVLLDVGAGGEFVLKSGQVSTLAGLATLVLFVFVFGPLPEEMGWRGVALDRLQRSMSPLAASLILGLAWSSWHLPLFFIDGTFQNQLGFLSFRFWVFMLDIIPLTIIMHWIYNHSDRSTLSAVFVHFSGNMCGALIVKTDQLAFLELVCLSVTALVVVAHSKGRLGLEPGTDLADDAKDFG